MITVAITGGTGFIGRVLVEAHLRRGDRVRVLTRKPGLEPAGTIGFEGDLARTVPPSFVDGADVIYHLAAETESRESMLTVNSMGTQRLLDASVGRCGRWIQLSSVGVYGAGIAGLPITESTKPCPSNEYERSKLDSDQRVAEQCSRIGCPWGILRPSNVVGSTMRNRSAFALVQAIVNGRFVYVGARDAVSTYIHVEDVVGALLCMAHAASGTIVNVSSDCPWTGLVQRICERARCKEPQIRIPEGVAQVAARLFGVLPRFPLTSSRVESLARRGGYPCDAARRILGFAPSRPMPQGFDEITDAVIAQT